MDAYFDDEPGYRVRADQFALPEISLESDEAAVVGLATQVWEHARLAEATTEAVSKLSAAGLALDLGALDIAQPRLSADEPAFDVFWEATVAAPCGHLRLPAARAPTPRSPGTSQPWGVVRFSGRWYVVGLDTDRGQERVFRLSRVVGRPSHRRPRRRRRPGRHRRPRGRPPPRARGAVGGGGGAGPARRRRGPAESVRGDRARRRRPRRRHAVGPAAPAERGRQADELLALGADVYVEQPAALRDEVVARLRAAAGALA